jgi:hypothetical protein
MEELGLLSAKSNINHDMLERRKNKGLNFLKKPKEKAAPTERRVSARLQNIPSDGKMILTEPKASLFVSYEPRIDERLPGRGRGCLLLLVG